MEYDPTSEIRNKFLRLALRRIDGEEYSQHIQHRHAAVIVKAGRVLSVGRNRNKTHPDSIATIYVARIGRSGDPGMSCPCDMCQGLISKYGLKRAIFTTDYGTGILEFSGEEL